MLSLYRKTTGVPVRSLLLRYLLCQLRSSRKSVLDCSRSNRAVLQNGVAAPLRVSVQNTPLPLPGTLSCSRSIRIRVVLLGHLSIENDQRVAHAAFHPADAVQESGRMHNGLALLTVNDLDAPVEEPKQLAALVVCI